MCERRVLFFFFAGGASLEDRSNPAPSAHAPKPTLEDNQFEFQLLGDTPKPALFPPSASSDDVYEEPKPPPPPPPGAPKAPKPPEPPAPAASCVNGFTVAPANVALNPENTLPAAHALPPPAGAKGLLLDELEELVELPAARPKPTPNAPPLDELEPP